LSGYADTSFLVSVYTPDANSHLAVEIMHHIKFPIFWTSFGEVELLNALQLRLFRRELTSLEVKEAHAAIRRHLDSQIYLLKPFSPAIFEKAKLLIQRHTRNLGVRTLDLLHVASALVLQADVFYSFDLDQRKLARAAGLRLP
jgi:predicted nucleic acid-binding protein